MHCRPGPPGGCRRGCRRASCHPANWTGCPRAERRARGRRCRRRRAPCRHGRRLAGTGPRAAPTGCRTGHAGQPASRPGSPRWSRRRIGRVHDTRQRDAHGIAYGDSNPQPGSPRSVRAAADPGAPAAENDADHESAASGHARHHAAGSQRSPQRSHQPHAGGHALAERRTDGDAYEIAGAVGRAHARAYPGADLERLSATPRGAARSHEPRGRTTLHPPQPHRGKDCSTCPLVGCTGSRPSWPSAARLPADRGSPPQLGIAFGETRPRPSPPDRSLPASGIARTCIVRRATTPGSGGTCWVRSRRCG